MFRIDAGSSGNRYCDGISRRSFVQIGLTGLGSLTLPQILQAKESVAPQARKNTAVILLWLDGGPSHMDMYDLKPEAPPEYRGIWTPIKTNVPGIEISELFPEQAKVADKFAILRSIHHPSGDHFTGAHYMLTGRDGANGGDTPGKSPSIGSIATRVVGARKPGMPPYVAVPFASSVGLRPGYFAGNYLGREYDPFETEGDPNADNFQVRNLSLEAGLTIDRLSDRRRLLDGFDQLRRDVDLSPGILEVDRFQRQAYELVTSPEARKAFDLSSEDPKLREQYGRDQLGQSLLLARRLVEAGSTFVTVHSGGWDHHWDIKPGYERILPGLDRAIATLLTDMSNRGTLDRVLFLMCGEFGRTPRMNDGGNGGPPMSMGSPGRDHWGTAGFCLLAGGGVKGGRIVGSTNRLGEVPHDTPVTPGDLHATIYNVLGVDPHTNFVNLAGRPVPAIDSGRVITELF